MLGFSFSFFVKLDTASLKKTDIRFVFLRLEDASGRFIEIFQEKENLVFRYESETLRTSAPVADRIQSNQWTLVTAMLNVTETQSVIVFRYGLEMSEDIIFRTVELDKKLTGAIGFTHGGTVESTGFSPVIMGRFALIFHPYTDWDFHCLHDNGFSELNRFRNVPLASSNCFQNAVAKREDQSIFGLMPRHVTFADFSTLFDRGRHRSPQFIEIALITLLECTDFQLCKTGKACMSLTDEDRSPFEFFTTITGIPERYLFEQGVPSLGFRFSMPLSEISTIISQLLRSNDFYIDSGLFPAFLEMIHATNDEGLILEILENVIFNLWIWGTSSQSHCQRMFRQLANFLSLFRFPNQHDLFVEFLLQSHWFENYSTHSFPGFHSLKLKVLEAIPLKSSDLPVFFQLICSLQDEHQIFDYLVLLARKSVVVPIDCLLALCDCVETCSFEIASQILAVVAGHTTGRRSTFELCLIRLALKWRDLSLVQLVNDELDVFCIHQLRAGARTAGGSPPLIKNFTSTTYFWVIFVSLRVDSREFEYVPLTLIDTGLDILSTQFSAVLNLLAIFKATGVFPNVFELALLFLERVLKVLVDNGTVVASKDKLRMFALRSFVALCYKLKKGSISSLLRKEFAKSPFSEEFAKGPRPTFETDFVVSSLPTIFSDSIRDLEFRPRVSDRDRSVFSFLIRFLELPEFEGDKLISQCRLFLQRQLPLLRQSELFAALQDFVSNLNSEVRRQLTEVQVLVNATPVPRSHQLMTDCLFCERLRLKHLHICAHPDESRFDQSPMSRFLRFPYPLPSRVAWTYLRESDEFIPAKLQYVPTKLALVYSTPCTLMTLAGQRQATFSILSSEIRISRIGAAVIAIPFDSISLLTYFHVNGVEIFTAGCQSHLVEFSNGEVPQVISILRGFDVPISRDQETTQKEVIGLWSHGKLSTFDLLLSLNILAGRSFHELFAYPIFPVIHQEDAAVLSEAAQTEQYAAAVSRWLLKMNLLCSGPTFPTAYDDLLRQNELDGMIPEVYFSFPAFNATDHSRIYESRRLFDSCHIKDWVERKFHVQLPPKVPIIVRRPAASWTVVHRKVSSGSFFEGGIDYFFTFSEEGCRLNVFYLVVGGTPPLVKLRSFRRSLSLSRDVHFCALMSVLLVVDVGKCRTYRIFDRPENDTLWQSLAVTHMRSLGNSIVFVIDSSIVAICRATLFPHRRRTIASETSRITLLQTSAAYSVVVYATEFAKVLILSGFDGVVLGKIEFSGEIVRNLLVTECWGFVLVNTNNAIYVLSLNGLLLARVEWAKVVVDWTSYQTANADMVVVLDARMKLSMFEAFRPQKIEKLTKLSEAIVAMSADGVKGVLALLTAGGRLMLLPLPEHG
jgi:hypothetical protein